MKLDDLNKQINEASVSTWAKYGGLINGTVSGALSTGNWTYAVTPELVGANVLTVALYHFLNGAILGGIAGYFFAGGEDSSVYNRIHNRLEALKKEIKANSPDRNKVRKYVSTITTDLNRLLTLIEEAEDHPIWFEIKNRGTMRIPVEFTRKDVTEAKQELTKLIKLAKKAHIDIK